MRLRGAGEQLEVDASRSQAGELFDVLLQQDNYVDFLADTYASGNSATKEQAVSYTTLLMTEEGFLNNLTPLQLLHLCTKQPDLIRDCGLSLPEPSAADDGGPLHMLLAGLPAAIDVLSISALLKYSNSSAAKDLASLPPGACLQDALRVLLEAPSFSRRITAADMWARDPTENTFLGALLLRSPMEELAHWQDVGEQIQVGDSLESAIAKCTEEMHTLQRAWEENQAATAALFRWMLQPRSMNQTLVFEWLEV